MIVHFGMTMELLKNNGRWDHEDLSWTPTGEIYTGHIPGAVTDTLWGLGPASAKWGHHNNTAEMFRD